MLRLRAGESYLALATLNFNLKFPQTKVPTNYPPLGGHDDPSRKYSVEFFWTL